MKIFLVGATGGLGSHVLHILLNETDVQILVYVRSPDKLNQLPESRVTVVQGDVQSIDPAILTDCEVIISTHSSPTHERYKGYQELVRAAQQTKVNRLIGVGGAGQLLLENGQIKQSEADWFPGLKQVTQDHQYGLEALRASELQWTWVAPAYMPTDAESSGGYHATRDLWNNGGMIPQIDVARFIVDEALKPQHSFHVVGLRPLSTK